MRELRRWSTAVVITTAALLSLAPTAPATAESMPYSRQEFSTSFLSDADVKALADWGSVVTDTPAGQECMASAAGGYDCGRVYPLGNTYSRPLRLEVKSRPTPTAAQTEFAQALARAKGSAYAVLFESPTEFSIESHPDANHVIVTSGRIDRNHYIESVCASRILNGSRVADVRSCTHLMLNAQQPRLATFESPRVSAPSAPVGLLASIAGGAATLTWLAPESDGGGAISAYTVTSADGSLSCSIPATADLLQRCVITGLRAGTQYQFTVTAINGKGSGPASQPSRPARFTQAASAPRNARARVTGTTASVSWKRPSDLGGLTVIRYVVTSTPGKLTCTTTRPTCSISGLAHSTRYRFEVRAINARGAGPAARTGAVRTPAPPAPSAPSSPAQPSKPVPSVD